MRQSPLFIIRTVILGAIGLTAAVTLSAQHGPAIDIPERTRGAARVVVGQVLGSDAFQQANASGDLLIVSHITLRVQEALKGDSAGTLQVEVEGGTVNGITMRASDMPTLQIGERAVFFVDENTSGKYVPHLRGYGILKLDSRDLVENSSLSLTQIRTMVRGAGR